MNKNNNLLIYVLIVFLALAIELGLVFWERTAMPSLPSPTITIQSNEMMTIRRIEHEGGKIAISGANIDIYTYRIDIKNQTIWSKSGQIPAGELIKVGNCSEDGYAQIEYPDPERPGWWRVAFERCILSAE